MIVSDRAGFIFVHIPKCAGTSVRRVLEPYHDADPRFLECVEEHPEFGRIDYTHLPLNLLEKVAPEVFDRFATHASYAVVRDPVQRFQSAMAQRAKMYLGQEIAQFDPDDLRQEVDDVIAYLESVPQVTSPDYIHFARQSDFVFAGGERLVREIYPVERLDALALAIGRQIGAQISFGHDNRTTVFRYPAVKRAAQAGSRIAKRMMPTTLHEAVRRAARRALMAPKEGAVSPVFTDPAIEDFIRTYYRTDFDLRRQTMVLAA